jgi:hypothetical protein
MMCCVLGGSLVEGPELVKRAGWYYLFFAAGKYCQDSYAEGVARARSIWGPYEKLGVPLLSTGLVGYDDSGKNKLVGPGHASFVQAVADGSAAAAGEYYAVYHASRGENCNRYAFVDRVAFNGADRPSNQRSDSSFVRVALRLMIHFHRRAGAGWPYIDFAASRAPLPRAPPSAPGKAAAEAGCRVVADCAHLAADPVLALSGPMECGGRHAMRIGAQAGGGPVPVCNV